MFLPPAVTFDIYNVSGDGFITRDELYSMMEATLAENDVALSPVQIMNLVDATFREADLNGDGKIDFAEFEVMVAKQPSILRPLTLNVSELLAGGIPEVEEKM